MRPLLLAATLLLGTAWAGAQAYPSQTAPDQSQNPSVPPTVQQGPEGQNPHGIPPEATPPISGQEQQAPSPESSNNATTVEGCLSGSDGNYTLAATSGTTYQLTGNTAELAKHVGHDIRVTGPVSSPATSTSGTGSQTGANATTTAPASQPTLDVTSFKHVSESCKTAGSR